MIATAPPAELDEPSIDAVVRHGYCMRLTGADRIEAIRRLAERGTAVEDIAQRLYIHPDHVRRLARPAGITFNQRQRHAR